jgi:putative methyltransferase (TIGR04325 family)
LNNTAIKNIIKTFLPEALIRSVSGIFYGWHGNFKSWEAAKSRCSGYDSAAILEKVKTSALKIKEGLAVYERDSFIFDKVQYSFPLLSSLMWAAAQNNGKLNVLDFGGSLGSTYFQNRKFLDSLSEVNWCVVEQPEFVKTGLQNFETKNLHFFYSIDECTKSYEINVVLMSSVLQYLEEPYKILDQIKTTGIKYLIIDRTPFINTTDRLTVQKVNPSIYNASYPCWFFNKQKLLSYLNADFELVLEFNALDKANIKSEFQGFLFTRK